MRALRLGTFGADIGRLVALSDTILEFGRGELIFRQDAASEHCFVIIEGAVKLVRNRPGNRQVLVTIIAEGEAYFDPAMFEASSYQAGCKAIAPILCIAKTALRDAMTCRPEFAFGLGAIVPSYDKWLIAQCIGAQPESFSRALKTPCKIGVHMNRDRVDIADIGKLAEHAAVERRRGVRGDGFKSVAGD
jgi:CRP-like cAMP-binding protein